MYLLGGQAAISAEVERQLSQAGLSTVRLTGPTRVETSIALAQQARYGSNAALPEVMVARAGASSDDPTQAWADAVAGGRWAAILRMPVLLTPSDALHPAVQAALAHFRTTSTVRLGGTAALFERVAASLPPAPSHRRQRPRGDRRGHRYPAVAAASCCSTATPPMTGPPPWRAPGCPRTSTPRRW